jgi:hypothetical protein
MYWSVTYGGVNTFPVGVVHRANLDGSGVEDLVRIDPGSIGAFVIDFTGLVGRETITRPEYGFRLGAAYPNPSSRTATIPFSLDSAGYVAVTLWDLTGRQLQTLAAGIRPAGRHELHFSTSELAAGLYVYRLDADGAALMGKLVVRH